MSYATEITESTNTPAPVGRFRLIFGFLMMISGLYFGLFTVGAGEGLGFLSLMASPFVMVTDK